VLALGSICTKKKKKKKKKKRRRRRRMTRAGEHADENVKWYSHCEKQCNSSSSGYWPKEIQNTFKVKIITHIQSNSIHNS
jgi:hypothetical protein